MLAVKMIWQVNKPAPAPAAPPPQQYVRPVGDGESVNVVQVNNMVVTHSVAMPMAQQGMMPGQAMPMQAMPGQAMPMQAMPAQAMMMPQQGMMMPAQAMPAQGMMMPQQGVAPGQQMVYASPYPQ